MRVDKSLKGISLLAPKTNIQESDQRILLLSNFLKKCWKTNKKRRKIRTPCVIHIHYQSKCISQNFYCRGVVNKQEPRHLVNSQPRQTTSTSAPNDSNCRWVKCLLDPGQKPGINGRNIFASERPSKE